MGGEKHPVSPYRMGACVSTSAGDFVSRRGVGVPPHWCAGGDGGNAERTRHSRARRDGAGNGRTELTQGQTSFFVFGGLQVHRCTGAGTTSARTLRAVPVLQNGQGGTAGDITERRSGGSNNESGCERMQQQQGGAVHPPAAAGGYLPKEVNCLTRPSSRHREELDGAVDVRGPLRKVGGCSRRQGRKQCQRLRAVKAALLSPSGGLNEARHET